MVCTFVAWIWTTKIQRSPETLNYSGYKVIKKWSPWPCFPILVEWIRPLCCEINIVQFCWSETSINLVYCTIENVGPRKFFHAVYCHKTLVQFHIWRFAYPSPACIFSNMIFPIIISSFSPAMFSTPYNLRVSLNVIPQVTTAWSSLTIHPPVSGLFFWQH